jgi:hypothetical protein
VGAIARLPVHERVHLVVVGDGNARAEIEALIVATELNVGHPVATIAGELTDPRPAYAIADIVAGSGTSVLRGMAFGKAGLALDSSGHATTLDERSLQHLLHEGPFVAAGGPLREPVESALLTLVRDARRREQAGVFGRRFVEEHRSTQHAVDRLEEIYDDLLREREVPTAREVMGLLNPFARPRTTSTPAAESTW